MDARVPAIADQLLLVERALRVHGLWSAAPPSAEALASQQPFCLDTLAFEEWLQWVFLPRMKLILENGQPLPRASGIRAMAEQVYVERLGSLDGLLMALEAFDQLIEAGS